MVGAVGTYPAVDDSMVLYYHFNNDSSVGETYSNTNGDQVNDYSYGYNNATTFNVTWNSTGGYLGDGAFEFKGFKNNITINNTLILNYSSGFSASAWVLVRNNSPFGMYIFQSLNLTGSRPYFGLYARDSTGVTQFTPRLIASATCDTSSTYTYGVAKNNSKWYYLSATFNGSRLTSYLNGELQRITDFSDACAAELQNQMQTNKIMHLKIGTSNFFDDLNGSVDDFILWNRTLSPSEILDIYNGYIECGQIPFDGCVVSNSITFLKNDYQVSNISIISSNLILDGNGSMLYYNNEDKPYTYSIYAKNVTNITIQNLNIRKNIGLITNRYYSSIYLVNITNSNLLNLNLSLPYSNTSDGIFIKDSDMINIFNSHINVGNESSKSYVGMSIELKNTTHSSIYNNTLNSNGTSCYGFYGNIKSNNNTIRNNLVTVYGSDSWGIHLEWNSSFNNVSYNDVKAVRNGSIGVIGILLELYASNNTVFNNTITSYDHGHGIGLDSGSYYNTISSNFFYGNGNKSRGIVLIDSPVSNPTGSKYNIIKDNLLVINNSNANELLITQSSYGIELQTENCSENTITNNSITMSYNANLFSKGIFIKSSDNMFLDNILNIDTRLTPIYSANTTNNVLTGNTFGYAHFVGNGTNHFYNLSSPSIYNSTLSDGSSITNTQATITLAPQKEFYIR